MGMSAKKLMIAAGSALAVIVIGGLLWWQFFASGMPKGKPIKVGVLYALTGTMAISEKSVVDGINLAIDEINASGGVHGRPVEAVIKDSQSDWDHANKMADKLINEDEVVVIFGCWTSACRKTVKDTIEKNDHLMIYPVQYEGLESSPNIVYLGASPNQQILPGLTWAVNNIGKKLFLVGSDYVFPRTANEIIKDYARNQGATVSGEEYVLLGATNFEDIVSKIKQAKPDVILNTLNGDSNVAFFNALRE